MEHSAFIVDVFAEAKFGGNQLAVVRNASSISDGEMQKIAREFNFSETTFILSDEVRDSGYDVRIFTPKEELPFAGHPTLGTAYVIQRTIIKRPIDEIGINLKVGRIPVAFTYTTSGEPDLQWMKQAEPSFQEIAAPKNFLAEMLQIDEGSFDPSFPAQEISTGLPTAIIPLRNLAAVKQARIDREKYFDFIERYSGPKSVLVFSRETYSKDNDLNVRVFVDYFGVPEDPATGSGNGCLAAYLVKNRYLGERKVEEIRVEQGYEIGRPSLLLLSASKHASGISVSVGGRVRSVLEGRLV